MTIARTQSKQETQRAVTPATLDMSGSTIPVDLASSNNFKGTLTGNKTLSNPTNMVDGAILNFAIKQDGTGSRTLAYDSKFDFGAAGAPTLSTGANKIDFISCYYDAGVDKLLCAFRGAA